MNKLTTLDIKIFTENLKRSKNIDFTDYAGAFMRHRIYLFMLKWNITNLDTLLIKLIESDNFLSKFIEFICVETTEMFRDPGFWRTFNKEVIPLLKKNDTINILVPQITSDDELYTLLIILYENNLLDRTNITATSPFTENIERTKCGCYKPKKFDLANENYKRYKQSPDVSLEHYFNLYHGSYTFKQELISHTKFLQANLKDNNIFPPEQNFNLILFRNRMIYYNLNLQIKILENLFFHLAPKGILTIGFKENITIFPYYDQLKRLDKKEKIFIKIK